MNINAINRTIHVLCKDIQNSDGGREEWYCQTEDKLLYEVCVCIFSSQMIFEVAEAAAQNVTRSGLLSSAVDASGRAEYERCLSRVLSEPVLAKYNGATRYVRPRFNNRLSSLLTATTQKIYGRGQSLTGILSRSSTATEARERLIMAVSGFGPKQASLFLRRIGYYTDFAVLDVHILDYLRIFIGFDFKSSSLSKLRNYERVEAKFQQVASEFGYPVGCVDLAMWVTMRAAKREMIQ